VTGTEKQKVVDGGSPEGRRVCSKKDFWDRSSHCSGY